MTESDLKYWKATLNKVVPDYLVTPEVVALRDQQNKMLNLMAKKNADYGNAFNKGCDKLGYRYGLARIYDKANRLIHLIEDDFQGYNNVNIKDESIFDTIQDLGNYCNMLLAWLDTCIQDDKEVKHEKSNKDDTVYTELYNLLVTNKVHLLDEETYEDVTEEIRNTYGFEDLARDNDGFVYNQNADNSMVIVTNSNKRQVIAVGDDWKASNIYKKKSDKIIMDENKITALEKFTILPNLDIFEPNGDYIVVNKEEDEGYAPTLYYYDKEYIMDWIGDEHDSILIFSGNTPEEVIDKGFDFCKDNNLIEII